MISSSRLQRIYNEIDGIEYMKQYLINFKQVGSSYKACCPFHHEKTPSFTIYPKGFMNREGKQDHDSFYCFGCAAGGDIITFVQLQYKLTREAAVSHLEKEFNLENINAEQIDIMKAQLQALQHRNVCNYSFIQINLLLSNLCRKYLEAVPLSYYSYESKLIDYYYRYIDYILPNCNNNDAYNVYLRIRDKLQKRLRRRIQNE